MPAPTDASPDLEFRAKLPERKGAPIGCIGAGFIMADCHLVAYREAGFNQVAISSRNRSTAQAAADRHSISKVYDHYEELLADPEIEVVDIAVPPDIQIDVVKAAAKEGSHIKGILAQKPLGIDYAQAVEIVRLC